MIFIKGFLDMMILKNLYEEVDMKFPFRYDYFREFRTAIDMTKETAKNGVCSYPDINDNVLSYSRDLLCLDVQMLLNGK